MRWGDCGVLEHQTVFVGLHAMSWAPRPLRQRSRRESGALEFDWPPVFYVPLDLFDVQTTQFSFDNLGYPNPKGIP